MSENAFHVPNIPRYLQLYYRLRDAITVGSYPFQSRIPSKRTMAAESGFSVITVSHAYELLCEEGYLESRERSGYFVSFRPESGFSEPMMPSSSIRHASKLPEKEGIPSFPPSVFAKAIRRVVSFQSDEILERSPQSGLLVLRDALHRHLKRTRGIDASVDQIIVAPGSESLYRMCSEMFSDRIFAVESPSYHQIEETYRSTHKSLELLPLTADGVDTAALWESGASVLHVTPYRSFPTGITASASKRHEYLQWADYVGGYLIEDDYESEFSLLSKPEETLFGASESDNVLYLNTFSRTISPAIRVAYMVLPRHLTESFQQQFKNRSCGVSACMQLVVAELLNSGIFERHIHRIRRKKRRERSASVSSEHSKKDEISS